MPLLSPHPVLTTLFGLPVYAHALFFVLGAEAAGLALQWLAERRGLREELSWPLALATFVSGLVGARIGFWLAYPGEVQNVLAIWQGGLLSYAGAIAGLAAFWLMVTRAQPERRLEWLDVAVAAGLLAWGLGRLGNYYGADSVGVAAGSWGATYGRVPIQLFEAAWCWAVGGALWRPARAGSWRPGIVAVAGLLAYFAGRAFIDSWRDEVAWHGLHYSQWASLLALILLLPVAFRYARR